MTVVSLEQRNAMTFSSSSRSYGLSLNSYALVSIYETAVTGTVRHGELDEDIPSVKIVVTAKRQWYWARYMNEAIEGHGYVCLYRDGFLTRVAVMRYTTRTSDFQFAEPFRGFQCFNAVEHETKHKHRASGALVRLRTEGTQERP